MLSKFRAFWGRYGYACVLSACVLMVALTAFFTRRPQPKPEAPQSAPGAAGQPKPRKPRRRYRGHRGGDAPKAE